MQYHCESIGRADAGRTFEIMLRGYTVSDFFFQPTIYDYLGSGSVNNSSRNPLFKVWKEYEWKIPLIKRWWNSSYTFLLAAPRRSVFECQLKCDWKTIWKTNISCISVFCLYLIFFVFKMCIAVWFNATWSNSQFVPLHLVYNQFTWVNPTGFPLSITNQRFSQSSCQSIYWHSQ